jgi:hypothetical protein
MQIEPDAERQRLQEAGDGVPWRRWGPYLAERQWATVREDYSADGNVWQSFPHDHARSRAYRWGEDGLLGICDDQARLCFALALWNEADPILKERLFGLTGPEGNHGEDVKEEYFYLDSTPTHSYMKALYKYPQRAFPYADLVEENRRRGRDAPEYELQHTGAFDDDAYFDVVVEYAKAGPGDILIRITATNRGSADAPLRLLPTLWFRNTWSWGYAVERPQLADATETEGYRLVSARDPDLGLYWLACQGTPALLFTENETNTRRIRGSLNGVRYAKDAINDAVVGGVEGATNPAGTGTKVAACYAFTVPAGESASVLLRLTDTPAGDPFAEAEAVFAQRIAEADAFYESPGLELDGDARLVLRQAYAGLLWSKQFFYYDVDDWLRGDPAGPVPPSQRLDGRNAGWRHLRNADVISMPDKWEYPWYAAWDLAFHCIPLARIDPEFAKGQLLLFLQESYLHPNGQLPAYEWALGDVNPPVHAWAVRKVYEIDRAVSGRPDRAFLERCFHKLTLNFTWWVNRKDAEGRNVFQGGFLGLDNIGVFDRSAPAPSGGHLEQADGTAWMAMFCLNMMSIALELARENPVYEDMATKFFEHFLYIAGAANDIGGEGIWLWDDEDGFFYDVLHRGERTTRLKVRSLVGLIPLLAVETVDPELLARLPTFKARLEKFLQTHPDLAALISRWYLPGQGQQRLFALVRGHRFKRLLRRMLDESEFLSHHGVRSLSRYHLAQPYMLELDGISHEVSYEPAESTTSLFGGNSNWRGPVWFPLNYLLIEALHKFHAYYGDDFLVEYPTGSGELKTIDQIAHALARRLTHNFLRAENGQRHILGGDERRQTDPFWRDLIPFHEYFNGDTGQGIGASHQTGWTALVATLLEETAQDVKDDSGPSPAL